MAQYEYDEQFIPYGPNRSRGALIDGLNKLGREGWHVITTKDIIAPQQGPGGAMLMVDGVRALVCRELAAPAQPEAMKRLKDKGAA